MGRLTCTDESKTGKKKDESIVHYPISQGPPSSLYMNTSKSIPSYQNQKKISFPPISSTEPRSQSTLLHRPSTSFAEIPSLQDRAQTSFQESAFLSETKELRKTAISPNHKLPPILTPKPPSTGRISSMPPNQNISEISGSLPIGEENREQYPSFLDLKIAYENMMASYFMPQDVKPETSLPSRLQTEQPQSNNAQRCNPGSFDPNYAYQSPNEINQSLQNNPPFGNTFYHTPSSNIENYNNSEGYDSSMLRNRTGNQVRKGVLQKSKNVIQTDHIPSVNQHTAMDITSSGCTVLDISTFGQFQEHSMNNATHIQPNEVLKSENNIYNPSTQKYLLL
ncbi:zinc finger protein GLIS3 [Caerostris extrusa]|uniref:Zinc finger protein GLIS3 n=1 Tax=Caerostris extrusa TaxID=172846 RepID=A0AAV4QGI3_CAEEX|nr:zinc finger protein GLIS3 [Caerostris extrusa]